MVAGMAAAFQSSLGPGIKAKGPEAVRKFLCANGKPQEGADAQAKHIGPLPVFTAAANCLTSTSPKPQQMAANYVSLFKQISP